MSLRQTVREMFLKRRSPYSGNITSFLKNAGIFTGLGQKELEEIGSISQIREYNSREFLIREGGNIPSLLIFVSGEVEVSKPITLLGKSSSESERNIIRLTAADRSCFGNSMIFQPDRISGASVTVVKPSVIIEICVKALKKIMAKNSRIGFIITNNVIKKVCNRLKSTNDDILKLTTCFSLAIKE